MLGLNPVQQSFFHKLYTNMLFSTHTWRKTLFSIILDPRPPQASARAAATCVKVNSCKSFLPNKAMRSNAVEGPIPHFIGEGGIETSLHCPHWEDNGFLLRSVLDYSDTNPHAVHPECGGNTPVIFEHHRKHITASRGRMKPPCGT